MTTGWSLFVIILTVLNILACLWLLRWTSKPRTANEKIGGGADTGHVWDKDLREYNNPLPRWWLWVFYITVAFGLIYLALFPGLGLDAVRAVPAGKGRRGSAGRPAARATCRIAGRRAGEQRAGDVDRA
jgi:hypothetical protein